MCVWLFFFFFSNIRAIVTITDAGRKEDPDTKSTKAGKNNSLFDFDFNGKSDDYNKGLQASGQVIGTVAGTRFHSMNSRKDNILKHDTIWQ